jgi:membrane protein DedA with SNARE-associated domain
VTLHALADALADIVSETGPFAPVVLFAATFVEYVFPPFPGDLVVVLGAWYAVHGELSWAATFVSVTTGSVAGAWVDYRIGVAAGRRLDRTAARRSAAFEQRLARFEASYRRWGAALLLLNRFLPGIRAFLFVAAGAAGIPLRRVLLLGGISAALWNVVLLAAGALVAQNVDELVFLFERYTRIAWAGIGAAALFVVVLVLWRRRAGGRARRADGGER